MMKLEDRYVDRCRELGVRPRRWKFRRTDRRARAAISVMVGRVTGEDVSPYVVMQIDRRFYYFVKVVGDTAYPCILTQEELAWVGYLRQEEYDESHHEYNNGDLVGEVPPGSAEEDGVPYQQE